MLAAAAEALEALLGLGADVNLRQGWAGSDDQEKGGSGSGATPLMLAVLRGHEAAVRALLSHPGLEIDAAADSIDGGTALHFAVQHGRTSVARLLIAAGADGGLMDKAGQTAQAKARAAGSAACLDLLTC